ncbi:hypothetical protein JWG45_21880 [Leptospira sp. 201903070]|uniref:Uncharacterized protein n=1 Tax=Leptospira ainlahdjerensis TaxID=2810033 RepID=A0ABS2UHF4_9LEPT|nr:hypothetical protein [Leptospira ainlahdjerensis]MBM9579801.1 hypothetical protein [Leptospira ainlahdjerensis]
MKKKIDSKITFQRKNSLISYLQILTLLLFATSLQFCKIDSTNSNLAILVVALLAGNSQTITSDPADSFIPGESPNRPILKELTVQTAYLNVGSGEQKIQVDVSFENNPPSPTLKVYLGRPSLMSLNGDGISVRNYMQEKLNPDSTLFPNRFSFFSPEITQRYKIIIVASNSFGKSSKEIISIPPTAPGGPCAGALNAPTTIGNCAEHCVQVDLNGNTMELTAKDTTAAVQDYFYLDLTTSTPSGGTGPTPFSYIEFGVEEPPIPVPTGTHSTPKKTLDTQTYDNACVVVSSYRVLDGLGGFSDHYLTQKIIVP